jgi:predicted regulator of Ras-like GTPase activity (Roadblock/LC7/MglB family)
MSIDTTQEIHQFHWLLEQFSGNTAGVLEAIAVSSDGFLLASSSGAARQNAEQLAAVTAGLASLTRGAAEMFNMDSVEQVLIEMSGGHMFISTISDGSSLAVLADKRADLGLVGYEMALMVERVGTVLSPELVHRLKNTLNG